MPDDDYQLERLFLTTLDSSKRSPQETAENFNLKYTQTHSLIILFGANHKMLPFEY